MKRKAISKDKLRNFDEIPVEELENTIACMTDYIVQWMKDFNIRAGSSYNYNLYGAVQKALRKEWDMAPKRAKEINDLL